MRRTIEECRARLVLCTAVAEHLAQILFMSKEIAQVGLYGSVARREPGRWCHDVDLMVFVNGLAEGNCCLHSQGARTAWFLREVGLAHRTQEIIDITCGFSAASDRYGMTEETFRLKFVPVSVHLLPATLDVDTICQFQAEQRDPDFLTKVGRDLLIWSAVDGYFKREGTPWDNLPWRKRMPDWLVEHGTRQHVSARQSEQWDERDDEVSHHFRVLGARYDNDCDGMDNDCDSVVDDPITRDG